MMQFGVVSACFFTQKSIIAINAFSYLLSTQLESWTTRKTTILACATSLTVVIFSTQCCSTFLTVSTNSLIVFGDIV